MAKVTQDELNRINDHFQILLRLAAMTHGSHGILKVNSSETQKCYHRANSIYDDMSFICRNLGLKKINCRCGTNTQGHTVTEGFLPTERGFWFCCVYCCRQYTWSEFRSSPIEMGYIPGATGNSFPTKNSSWIHSVEGRWDSDRFGMTDVVINRNKDGEIHHKFIPYDIWIEWAESSSVGKFWHQEIKGKWS